MELTEFINFYSNAYKSFNLLSPDCMRENAAFLEGYAAAQPNDKMENIAKTLRDAAHMITVLKEKAYYSKPDLNLLNQRG